VTTRRLLLNIALLLALVTALPVALAQDGPTEVPVRIIELAGTPAEPEAEISGLAWYGDMLVLMTENPNLYASEGNVGKFYALAKQDLLAYLDSEDAAPLEPVEVPLMGPDIVESVPGFDGFESIVFVGDTVYLTIEAQLESGEMRGYLVRGTVEPDLSAITLDLERQVELIPQAPFDNMSYEATFVADGVLVTFYEANGAGVNENPVAYVVSEDLETVEQIPTANLEFRLTDVTALDEENRFWGINYFFPGEGFLATESDPLVEAYGEGATHGEYEHVERLVAFEYSPEGITLADMPPILLELPGEDARNWEGIVRLDERGFLLVTDQYPETLLGFVASPEGEAVG